MRRVPMGATVAGGVALAASAGLLGVAVFRAVTVEPAIGEAAPAPGEAAPVIGEPASAPGDPTAWIADRPGDSAVADRPGATPGGGRFRGAVEGRFGSARPEGAGDAPVREAGEPPAADPLTLAAENDPFNPDREPPLQRYRLPSERAPVAREEVREERPQAPDLRVVGAAAGGRGGAALIQLEGGEPRLLATGESVGGYTLAAVDAESATLVGPAGRLRLPVTEPLGEADDGGGRGRRGRNADDQRSRAQEQVEQRMQQLQQIMRRLQTGGRGRGGNGVFIPNLPPGGSVDLPVRLRVTPTGGRGRGGGAPPSSDAPSDG